MAILKVAMMGNPVLRAKAQPVPENQIQSPRVQQLIDDLFETMHEYEGIGLAAPQVHQSVRIFVAGLRQIPVTSPMADEHEMPYVALINPEIVPSTDRVSEGWEGCLSIPDVRGLVPRATDVRVRAFDRQGRRIEFAAGGLPARVLQHELDHLDGILFFDRMKSFASLTYMDEYRKYWAKDDEESGEKAEAKKKSEDKQKMEGTKV